MKYLLFIFIVFIIGCSSQQVIEEKDDTIIHAYSGVKFKSQLGPFTRGEQRIYDLDGNNVSFSYYSDVDYPLLLTLYVYPVDKEDIPEAAGLKPDEQLKLHFSLCEKEIKEADESDTGINTTLIKEEKTRVHNIELLRALYDYEINGRKFESDLYLTCFRNSFLKIRATFDKNRNAEVYMMIHKFIENINWEDSQH